MFGPQKTTVLVAESHPQCLLRCAAAVRQDERLRLVAAVSTVADVMATLKRHTPDVVVVDLQLPDAPAMDVIRYVVGHHPQSDVVVLTQFGNDEQVLGSIEAGATAYVFKDDVTHHLGTSLRLWRQGTAPISPNMARRVLGRFRLQAGISSSAAWAFPLPESSHPLTDTEAGILRWIARGMTLEQIGNLADTSSQMVECHVKHIYRKLAVHARGETLCEAKGSETSLAPSSLAV